MTTYHSSKLLQLPTEIWDQILSFLPNSMLQSTTLSLLATLSTTTTHHPISILHLFKHLVIRNDADLKQLLHHSQSSQIHSIPRSFSLQSWKLLDNNILINLINSLSSHIQFIQLFVGPVFSPDQLEELFFKPKSHLVSLCLRFNQNMSRRSYEPFLKGSYFDNCCDLLAKWPPSRRFRSLSFVQDLPPPYEKSRLINEAIAQPIILFKFWCITNLATSPVGRNLSNLRLRIPNRNVTIALTNNTTKFESIPIGHHPTLHFKLPIDPFPNLKFLDLSTSLLPTINPDLVSILKRFPRLEYLMLDRTQLIYPSRFQGDEERVNETLRLIGSTASSIGVSRAIEITRIWRDLKKMMETELKEEKLRSNGIIHHDSNPPMSSPTVREDTKRRGRSSYASAPKWKSGPSTSSKSATDHTTVITPTQTNQLPLAQQRIPSKLIILPSPSNLISLCCGTDLTKSSELSEADHDNIRNQWDHQFQIGWQSGLDKLEKSVLEKLDEYKLSMEIWKKSLVEFQSSQKRTLVSVSNKKKNRPSANDTGWNDVMEKEYEEELAKLIRSKPILMIQEPNLDQHLEADEANNNKPATEMIEIFKEKMRIQEVEVSEEEEGMLSKLILEKINLKNRMKKGVNFCSLNDCDACGKVVWDRPRVSINLINLNSSVIKHHPNPINLHGDVNVTQDQLCDHLDHLKIHDLEPLSTSTSTSTSTTSTVVHSQDCAHIVARKLWNLDSF